MNKDYRVIVAHPLGQHSDKLAVALKQEGMLHTYITSSYYKNGTMTKLLSYFFKGDNKVRLQAKRCQFLKDGEVKVFGEFIGILMLAVNRVDKRKVIKYKVDRLLSNHFGRKVARYAIREKADAVVMYDLYAGAGFDYLKRKAPQIKRIMDASAAYVGDMRNTFEKECKKDPGSLDDYKKAYSQFWNKGWSIPVLNEVRAVEYVIAASSYSQRGYQRAGIRKDNIFIVPYGVDAGKFEMNRGQKTEMLKIIYVGNANPGKGLQYLLQAAVQMKEYRLQVVVVGIMDTESTVYQKYHGERSIDFIGKVNFEDMKKYYQESDIFILPSLSDGFSLSGLEAMACGIPVICTENMGISDLISEGKNGFIVPAGNVKALQERIEWCCKNREGLESMRTAARQTAETYSWGRYNKKIIETFYHIFESNTVGGRYE